MTTECIFCQIINGESPSSVVHRDETCIVFMDIQPVNPGHMLVVPLKHAACLAEMNPDTGGHLFKIGQYVAAALRESNVRCEGVNLFLADGEAAGQDVFHVHLHVLPRYVGDGFDLTFDESYWDLPARDELDRIATDIKNRTRQPNHK